MSRELIILTLEDLINGGLTIVEACERLSVHRSTLWRLRRRYEARGAEGLKHGLEGKRSNRAKPEEFKRQLCELYERDYKPNGHSIHHFYESVARNLPDYVSYSTVLGWLRKGGETQE